MLRQKQRKKQRKGTQQNVVSKLPDPQLFPLNFNDVDLNSWVLVLYEREKFSGHLLTKAAGKFEAFKNHIWNLKCTAI